MLPVVALNSEGFSNVINPLKVIWTLKIRRFGIYHPHGKESVLDLFDILDMLPRPLQPSSSVSFLLVNFLHSRVWKRELF